MTNVRKEWLAQKCLKFLGFDTFFPHYTEWTKPTRAKPTLLTKPYFTRYIFVGLNGGKNQSIFTVNHTIGVSAVVYNGAEALCLPQEFMDELMSRTDESGHLLPEGEKRPQFPGEIGDFVGFTENSPLFGFIAEIKRVDSTGKLMVKLSKMLGAERTVEVDRTDIGAIYRPDGSPRAYEPASA